MAKVLAAGARPREKEKRSPAKKLFLSITAKASLLKIADVLGIRYTAVGLGKTYTRR